MLEQSARPQRGAGVLLQEVAGSIVLLKPTTGQYYALEEVSRDVWAACDGNHTVAAIIAKIQQEYDADPAEIEADILALLQEFLDEQLVTTDC